MGIQLGQIAPDFEQDSTHGAIHFHDWLGSSWAVLFSYPESFTLVCATELRTEWVRLGVKPIGLSVGPVEVHRKLESDIAPTQGSALDFPIVADPEAKVSTLYGMIPPERDPKGTARSVFVIDPTKKVRLILTYPPSGSGRSFAEILKTIDSLQLTDAFDPVI